MHRKTKYTHPKSKKEKKSASTDVKGQHSSDTVRAYLFAILYHFLGRSNVLKLLGWEWGGASVF